jgi:hypothetical protein
MHGELPGGRAGGVARACTGGTAAPPRRWLGSPAPRSRLTRVSAGGRSGAPVYCIRTCCRLRILSRMYYPATYIASTDLTSWEPRACRAQIYCAVRPARHVIPRPQHTLVRRGPAVYIVPPYYAASSAPAASTARAPGHRTVPRIYYLAAFTALHAPRDIYRAMHYFAAGAGVRRQARPAPRELLEQQAYSTLQIGRRGTPRIMPRAPRTPIPPRIHTCRSPLGAPPQPPGSGLEPGLPAHLWWAPTHPAINPIVSPPKKPHEGF